MNLINILQGLGSNEQSLREKHLSLLNTHLKSQKSIKEEGTSNRIEKYLHMWNALFYFFWNTDKSIVQKASATQIANLLYSIKDKSNFLLSCFDSFNSKWSKIDFLRLDKYIMLMDTVYSLFYNYVSSKGKFKNIRLLFEGVRRISTMNSLYILKNDSTNSNSLSSSTSSGLAVRAKGKIDYSLFAKYINFSFFRNFTKNIGVYIDVICKDNEALLALFKLFGILPKRESELFQELVLNKLYKQILLFDNKRKYEVKEMLNSLIFQYNSKSDLNSHSSQLSKFKLGRKFTYYGISSIKLLFEKVFVVGENMKMKKEIIKDYDLDNEATEDENIFLDLKLKKDKLNYIVDPVHDSILQRNYLTKFRMSNVDKMKILSEKNKVNKALEDQKNKLKELKNKDKKASNLEYNQVTIKLSEDEKTEENCEYQSDFEGLSSEESDIEEEKVNEKEKVDVKEKNFLNEKRKLSNNSSQEKDNHKEKESNCVLFNPKISSPIKLNENIKIKQDENKIRQTEEKEIKPIPIKPVEVKEKKIKKEIDEDDDDDEILSDLDEDDVDFNFKVEVDENKNLMKNKKKDSEEEENEENDSEEDDEEAEEDEDNEDGEEYEDCDDYEEGEEGEEIDDDLEDFEDIYLDEESISKLPKKQQMFIAQLMQPPDFKKDLFKKGAGENDVDYKSLKLAIENSNSNMKFFKNLKKEAKNMKKGKGLLSNVDKNKKKIGKKVKFDTYFNQVKKFDKKKTILLESVRSKNLEILPNPNKSCIRKS